MKTATKTYTYQVFWTFIANHADKWVTVEAENAVEAIKRASFYDPYAKSSTGNQMMFSVIGESDEFYGLIGHGTIETFEGK